MNPPKRVFYFKHLEKFKMTIVVNPLNIDKVASFANTPSTSYRSVFMKMTAASVIGGGAGSSVVTAVTFTPALPSGATNIQVYVTPDQDAVEFVTAISATGFTFTLNPRLAANTLAVGSNNILVTWDI